MLLLENGNGRRSVASAPRAQMVLRCGEGACQPTNEAGGSDKWVVVLAGVDGGGIVDAAWEAGERRD